MPESLIQFRHLAFMTVDCYDNYDCAVTATTTTVRRHATSCDFVFTVVTATVM